MDSKSMPALALLERLPLTAVVVDIDGGQVIWANTRDLSLIGAMHPSDVIGRSVLEFLRPEDQEKALRDIEAISRGESPPPVVYRAKRLDGGSVWIQISSVPMWLDGKPAMLSLLNDVSDQQRALQALSESEERYRELVENMPDGIMVVLRSSVVYCNPALLGALGATQAEQVVGRSLYEFIAEEQRKAVADARRSMLATRTPISTREVRMLRLDGSPLEAVARSAPVQWHGELASQTILSFAE